ncbi:hypothetical protein E7T06_08485 [Deinococcus sp. Arct2-2]|uniref:hypothetical protein n=1 Tax=Deinococcus sp. Arct2-2 TaxID=2568653 RepID=UPI0010A4E0F5|nr:hypothetical protein [Deinococcus sp. Arct2-2]THF70213.1 hypothetical protein E7T06_08485 [Deinococcus sp. Arct2-2]
MTDPFLLTPAEATRFVEALLGLMIEHGLSSLIAGQGGGQLGLTGPGQFVTQDLNFHFMSPEEHRSAAQAYQLPAHLFRPAAGPRTDQDAGRFVRALGQLFDLHGVYSLQFESGAHLGFRADGAAREFVLEGVKVNTRP